MSVEENKAMALFYIEEMQNKKNLMIADKVCTEDCIIHLGQASFNKDEYKNLVRRNADSFPDAHTTVDDQIAEEDRVATRWTTRFTHKGQFKGVAPTYKQLAVTGISVYRFSEGKIAEIWISWDRLSLMQQLGVVPSFSSKA